MYMSFKLGEITGKGRTRPFCRRFDVLRLDNNTNLLVKSTVLNTRKHLNKYMKTGLRNELN